MRCGCLRPGVGGAELAAVTWFLTDSARRGSSAARAALLSRMKSRMKLVNQVALTMRWNRTRILRASGGSGGSERGLQASAASALVSAEGPPASRWPLLDLPGPPPFCCYAAPSPPLTSPPPTLRPSHGSHQNMGQAALQPQALRLTAETPGELWSVI